MSAPDHELALDIARRLQLAQMHGNPGHVLLALAAAGHAVAEHGAEAFPEALAAVGEALPALAQSLDPDARDLATALNFKTACGLDGHQLRAAQREYERHRLLAEVERLVREKDLKTRAACREVGLANGVPASTLRNQLRNQSLQKWPETPGGFRATPSVPDDEASSNASAVLAPKI